MIDLLLDQQTGDLSLKDGDLQIVDQDAAIRQDLLQRLRFFLGEWFLDTTEGVPYYQTILVKNPDLNLIQATIQNTILSTDGIVDLLRFEFDYDNATRKLSISFDAKSTTGTIIKVNQDLSGGI